MAEKLKFNSMMLETDEGLLNDIIIEFETIDDEFEKAIAQYKYPFADGVDLEDMGQNAHVMRFRCWFWDEGDHQTYEMHTLLLTSLETKELLDFVHPKYGLMKGKIEHIGIHHDDSIRTASIDIIFIEQMRNSLSVDLAESVESAVAEAYQTGQEEQQSLLAQAIAAVLPAADAAAVSAVLDEAQGILTQMQGFSNTTRAFAAKVEAYLATAEAGVNQVVSPINSLQATLTYSLDLPGRILGAISLSVEKTARLYDSLRNYPGQFISKLDDAFDDLQDSFADLADGATSTGAQSAGLVMADHLQIACAQRMALEAAGIYADDNDAANNVSGTSEVQAMNINELESTLAVVRTRIAAALAIARDMESLKTMSAALLTQVNSVRLEREKMIAVALDNPMPLHLVCLKYGLPYTDAERLLKVNSIRNPNFASGEIKVYARQS